MIETVFDTDNTIRYVSIVPPLSDEEAEALRRALVDWQARPIVWLPFTAHIAERFEPEIEDTP